jgi:hypothetical protein
VRDFAIPLQSRALAILLNVPDAEAAIWIGWGTHVFRDGNGTSKGAALEAYTNALLDRAAARRPVNQTMMNKPFTLGNM